MHETSGHQYGHQRYHDVARLRPGLDQGLIGFGHTFGFDIPKTDEEPARSQYAEDHDGVIAFQAEQGNSRHRGQGAESPGKLTAGHIETHALAHLGA